MKKLLLILSLISLPAISSTNSLNISVNGKTNHTVNLDLFISFITVSYDSIHVVKYEKENNNKSFLIFTIGDYDFNTDSLVNEIMKIYEVSLNKNNAKELVICIDRNNNNSSYEIHGITINDLTYIKQLSTMQNKDSEKNSACIIPKKVMHKNTYSSKDKTVTVIADVIDLKTGDIIRKEEVFDNLYCPSAKQMNISTIFTTVARLNMINESYKTLYSSPKPKEETKDLKQEQLEIKEGVYKSLQN